MEKTSEVRSEAKECCTAVSIGVPRLGVYRFA
jgi:hypothetical protein